jgi:hypothetical protein
MSTDSFTSSTEGPAMPRPALSQPHSVFYNNGGNGSGSGSGGGSSTALAHSQAYSHTQPNGLAAAFTPTPTPSSKRVGGALRVHAAHQPSFSSESEFGASHNVFNLDDTGHEHQYQVRQLGGSSLGHGQAVATGPGAASFVDPGDILDAPVRPWNTAAADRSRTPSPRDANAREPREPYAATAH